MNLVKKLRDFFKVEVPTVRERVKMAHPAGDNYTTVVQAQVWEKGRWHNIREIPVTSGRDIATAVSMAKVVIEEYKAADVDEKGVVAL